MSGAPRYFWPLLILVALAQSVALFKMVYDRDRQIKSGREITIAVKPLDPRDIFRGDYVTLGYDISSLDTSNVSAQTFKDYERGSVAYVTLTPGPDGKWALGSVAPVFPKNVAASDVVLKARVKSVWVGPDASRGVINLRYGIETYFVPEGTGRALEDKVREHKIDAIVAVGEDGTAVLKGLAIDGERHVDPPLL